MSSKRKLIRDNVLEVLQGISKDKGYNHTVASVLDKREALSKLRSDQLPAIFLTYGSPEVSEFETADGGWVTSELSVILFCYLRPERGTSEMDAADELIEDIKKALYADVGRDGNAESTLIRSVTVDALTETAYVAIDMMLNIRYSHQRELP